MATYLAGQTVRLSCAVEDDDGPADPATLSLTITQPDATTVSKVIGDFTRVSTGVYRYDFIPSQSGDHDWRIVSTVPADAFEGSFDVDAAGAHFADPVSLEDVKAHLNMSAITADDAELQAMVNAAVGIIEDLVGPINPVDVTEIHDGGSRQIVLNKWPVLSVQSVTDLIRSTVYTTDSSAGGYYYLLDDGILTLLYANWDPGYPMAQAIPPRFLPGYSSIQVVYTAGRSVVSDKLKQAIAEQVRHLWQTQQGSRGRQTEDWAPQMAYAIPNRVRELIGRDELGPAVA